MVIEDVNPPSEMRRVMLPYEGVEGRTEQPATQPVSLRLIPLNKKGSLVQPAETAPERPVLESTLVLVVEPENEAAITESKIAPLSTLMPDRTIATVSQDVPTTLVTAQTLLLLTPTPKYDRIATPAISEPQ